MKRNKFNQVQILSDNDDRSILSLLEVGDYVVCYNKDCGTITAIDTDLQIVNVCVNINLNIVIKVKMINIKGFVFVKTSWTREEVEELIKKHTLDNIARGGTNRVVTCEWINENL